MEAKEFRKMLQDDPKLAQKLGEAMGRNANLEELSGILTGAGVDTATVDDLLAEYQRKRGAALSAQELDDGELDQVAGGGDGICDWTDNCDDDFINYAQVPKDRRCDYSEFCDEMYMSPYYYNG